MDRQELEWKLSRLPRRGISAFAARCARRLQPLGARFNGDMRRAVDRAIAAAEDFARGELQLQGVAAAAAANAWKIASESSTPEVASKVASAASAAAWSVAAETKQAAITAAASAWSAAAKTIADNDPLFASDIDQLLHLRLNRFLRPAGKPIDPSEFGPLGPLWPDSFDPDSTVKATPDPDL